MPVIYPLRKVACLPSPADNCAIALRRLEPGSLLETPGGERFTPDFTVLEGHRFAVKTIGRGETLLSWGMPCGFLKASVCPGTFICNDGLLTELRTRDLDFRLPGESNLEDFYEPYRLDGKVFKSAQQVRLYLQPGSFLGFERSSKRGVGTRNHVVIIAANSAASSYARQLAERCRDLCDHTGNIDGIVAVAHTEGGGITRPNNEELVLRTLAGFMVHPNVGAVLVADDPTGWIQNDQLRDFLARNLYPIADVPHAFISLTSGFENSIGQGRRIISNWLQEIDSYERTSQPLSALRLGLQCGGSDSLSGVSANPLVGRLAKEVIRHGGSANLAETVELVGAEAYLLDKVRDLETAERFLEFVESFKAKMSWHGHSPESNPSGGNRFRGLFNISVKSLGAAMKKDPEVRLDFAIDYSERMSDSGFYFMNSPGNDLESVAGQVASGVNLILFTTGNGSITNFPFVPTLKVLSTTARYEMLQNEIDINAGLYLDGTPMDSLTSSAMELCVETASGKLSKGERARHHQVSIWRNWQQTGPGDLRVISAQCGADAVPLNIKKSPELTHHALTFTGLNSPAGPVVDQVALLVPASLCSSQVAQMLAVELNQNRPVSEDVVRGFVSFGHTEGCGATSGHSENLLVQTLLGYLRHPMVRFAVVLEHGCEKVHNEYLRGKLRASGIDPSNFGWASIQLDGGIQKARSRIRSYFAKVALTSASLSTVEAGGDSVSLGILSVGPCSDKMASMTASIVNDVVGSGGTIVIPCADPLLESHLLPRHLGVPTRSVQATLPYGGYFGTPGLHLMEMPTVHWVERLSGLGASGVNMILAFAGSHPLQGHPFVPMVQVSCGRELSQSSQEGIDLVFSDDEIRLDEIYRILEETASRRYMPKALRQGNVDFQMTRGPLGFSV